MDLNNIACASFGVGIMLNSFGLNRYIRTLNIDQCSKVNLHMGLSAFFIAGALKTYKAIRA